MSKVSDVMTRDVVTMQADATLRETLDYFATQHISGAAVMDHKHRLIGAITRSDIIESEAEILDPEARARFLDDTLVRDRMTSPALTIAPDANLREAALAMEYGDVHRLFVEVNGDLVGVISRTDVSRAVATGSV
jgi:CBS-domain-containing membrane protein